MDDNPYRSPMSEPEASPRNSSEPLRFREVFVIASAMAFMGTATLSGVGAARIQSFDSESIESTLAGLAASKYFLGLLIAVSLGAGGLFALTWKLASDFRAWRNKKHQSH